MVGTPALSEPEEEVDFEVDTADEARDARQKPARKRSATGSREKSNLGREKDRKPISWQEWNSNEREEGEVKKEEGEKAPLGPQNGRASAKGAKSGERDGEKRRGRDSSRNEGERREAAPQKRSRERERAVPISTNAERPPRRERSPPLKRIHIRNDSHRRPASPIPRRQSSPPPRRPLRMHEDPYPPDRLPPRQEAYACLRPRSPGFGPPRPAPYARPRSPGPYGRMDSEYPPFRRPGEFPPERLDPLLRFDPELERLRELERRRIMELEQIERERAMSAQRPVDLMDPHADDPRRQRSYPFPASAPLDDPYGPRHANGERPQWGYNRPEDERALPLRRPASPLPPHFPPPRMPVDLIDDPWADIPRFPERDVPLHRPRHVSLAGPPQDLLPDAPPPRARARTPPPRLGGSGAANGEAARVRERARERTPKAAEKPKKSKEESKTKPRAVSKGGDAKRKREEKSGGERKHQGKGDKKEEKKLDKKVDSKEETTSEKKSAKPAEEKPEAASKKRHREEDVKGKVLEAAGKPKTKEQAPKAPIPNPEKSAIAKKPRTNEAEKPSKEDKMSQSGNKDKPRAKDKEKSQIKDKEKAQSSRDVKRGAGKEAEKPRGRGEGERKARDTVEPLKRQERPAVKSELAPRGRDAERVMHRPELHPRPSLDAPRPRRDVGPQTLETLPRRHSLPAAPPFPHEPRYGHAPPLPFRDQPGDRGLQPEEVGRVRGFKDPFMERGRFGTPPQRAVAELPLGVGQQFGDHHTMPMHRDMDQSRFPPPPSRIVTAVGRDYLDGGHGRGPGVTLRGAAPPPPHIHDNGPHHSPHAGEYPLRLRSGVQVGGASPQIGAVGGTSLPMPPPDPSNPYRNAGRPGSKALQEDDRRNEWYYMDPQGNVQGPSSKAQLRIWLTQLANGNDRVRHQAFCRVNVWREGMRQHEGIQLLRLLQA